MADDKEQIMYDSSERGDCYKCIRILWCGCCEPYQTITSKYVKVHRWQGCSQITDSMSMDAIFDIKRRQSFCCCLASCCCGCCIDDFANIHLFGRDEENQNGLELIHVARSKQVCEDVTKLLQTVHKDFRLQGRNLAQKLEQDKKEP